MKFDNFPGLQGPREASGDPRGPGVGVRMWVGGWFQNELQNL